MQLPVLIAYKLKLSADLLFVKIAFTRSMLHPIKCIITLYLQSIYKSIHKKTPKVYSHKNTSSVIPA